MSDCIMSRELAKVEAGNVYNFGNFGQHQQVGLTIPLLLQLPSPADWQGVAL